MADRNLLKSMIDSIMDENPEKAKTHFHDFATQRVRDLLYPQQDDESQNVADENQDSQQ